MFLKKANTHHLTSKGVHLQQNCGAFFKQEIYTILADVLEMSHHTRFNMVYKSKKIRKETEVFLDFLCEYAQKTERRCGIPIMICIPYDTKANHLDSFAPLMGKGDIVSILAYLFIRNGACCKIEILQQARLHI